jgi:hypothetical protein
MVIMMKKKILVMKRMGKGVTWGLGKMVKKYVDLLNMIVFVLILRLNYLILLRVKKYPKS